MDKSTDGWTQSLIVTLSRPNEPYGSDPIESVGGCWNGMYMEASEEIVMIVGDGLKKNGKKVKRMAVVVIKLQRASECL